MEKNRKCDVIVVGGGVSGVVAAVAAGRNGADTLLVEQNGYLGGVMTAVEVPHVITFHDGEGTQILRGIAQEIVEGLQKIGGSPGHVPYHMDNHLYSSTPFDPELTKHVLLELCLEADVNLLLYSYFVQALSDGKNIQGVVVENKSGRVELPGEVVVDATGDAHVAAKMGAAFDKLPREQLQPMTLLFRLGNVDVGQTLRYVKEHPEHFKIDASIDWQEFSRAAFTENCFDNFPPWIEALKTGKLPAGQAAGTAAVSSPLPRRFSGAASARRIKSSLE